MASDGEWIYGYKLHFLPDLDPGEMMGMELTTAHWYDAPIGLQLLEELSSGKRRPDLILTDAA